MFYRYQQADGNIVELSYIADKNGFQPSSDMLPVGPAMPAHSLLQAEKARLERLNNINSSDIQSYSNTIPKTTKIFEGSIKTHNIESSTIATATHRSRESSDEYVRINTKATTTTTPEPTITSQSYIEPTTTNFPKTEVENNSEDYVRSYTKTTTTTTPDPVITSRKTYTESPTTTSTTNFFKFEQNSEEDLKLHFKITTETTTTPEPITVFYNITEPVRTSSEEITSSRIIRPATAAPTTTGRRFSGTRFSYPQPANENYTFKIPTHNNFRLNIRKQIGEAPVLENNLQTDEEEILQEAVTENLEHTSSLEVLAVDTSQAASSLIAIATAEETADVAHKKLLSVIAAESQFDKSPKNVHEEIGRASVELRANPAGREIELSVADIIVGSSSVVEIPPIEGTSVVTHKNIFSEIAAAGKPSFSTMQDNFQEVGINLINNKKSDVQITAPQPTFTVIVDEVNPDFTEIADNRKTAKELLHDLKSVFENLNQPSSKEVIDFDISQAGSLFTNINTLAKMEEVTQKELLRVIGIELPSVKVLKDEVKEISLGSSAGFNISEVVSLVADIPTVQNTTNINKKELFSVIGIELPSLGIQEEKLQEIGGVKLADSGTNDASITPSQPILTTIADGVNSDSLTEITIFGNNVVHDIELMSTNLKQSSSKEDSAFDTFEATSSFTDITAANERPDVSQNEVLLSVIGIDLPSFRALQKSIQENGAKSFTDTITNDVPVTNSQGIFTTVIDDAHSDSKESVTGITITGNNGIQEIESLNPLQSSLTGVSAFDVSEPAFPFTSVPAVNETLEVTQNELSSVIGVKLPSVRTQQEEFQEILVAPLDNLKTSVVPFVVSQPTFTTVINDISSDNTESAIEINTTTDVNVVQDKELFNVIINQSSSKEVSIPTISEVVPSLTGITTVTEPTKDLQGELSSVVGVRLPVVRTPQDKFQEIGVVSLIDSTTKDFRITPSQATFITDIDHINSSSTELTTEITIYENNAVQGIESSSVNQKQFLSKEVSVFNISDALSSFANIPTANDTADQTQKNLHSEIGIELPSFRIQKDKLQEIDGTSIGDSRTNGALTSASQSIFTTVIDDVVSYSTETATEIIISGDNVVHKIESASMDQKQSSVKDVPSLHISDAVFTFADNPTVTEIRELPQNQLPLVIGIDLPSFRSLAVEFPKNIGVSLVDPGTSAFSTIDSHPIFTTIFDDHSLDSAESATEITINDNNVVHENELFSVNLHKFSSKEVSAIDFSHDMSSVTDIPTATEITEINQQKLLPVIGIELLSIGTQVAFQKIGGGGVDGSIKNDVPIISSLPIFTTADDNSNCTESGTGIATSGGNEDQKIVLLSMNLKQSFSKTVSADDISQAASSFTDIPTIEEATEVAQEEMISEIFTSPPLVMDSLNVLQEIDSLSSDDSKANDVSTSASLPIFTTAIDDINSNLTVGTKITNNDNNAIQEIIYLTVNPKQPSSKEVSVADISELASSFTGNPTGNEIIEVTQKGLLQVVGIDLPTFRTSQDEFQDISGLSSVVSGTNDVPTTGSQSIFTTVIDDVDSYSTESSTGVTIIVNGAVPKIESLIRNPTEPSFKEVSGSDYSEAASSITEYSTAEEATEVPQKELLSVIGIDLPSFRTLQNAFQESGKGSLDFLPNFSPDAVPKQNFFVAIGDDILDNNSNENVHLPFRASTLPTVQEIVGLPINSRTGDSIDTDISNVPERRFFVTPDDDILDNISNQDVRLDQTSAQPKIRESDILISIDLSTNVSLDEVLPTVQEQKFFVVSDDNTLDINSNEIVLHNHTPVSLPAVHIAPSLHVDKITAPVQFQTFANESKDTNDVVSLLLNNTQEPPIDSNSKETRVASQHNSLVDNFIMHIARQKTANVTGDTNTPIDTTAFL